MSVPHKQCYVKYMREYFTFALNQQDYKSQGNPARILVLFAFSESISWRGIHEECRRDNSRECVSVLLLAADVTINVALTPE